MQSLPAHRLDATFVTRRLPRVRGAALAALAFAAGQPAIVAFAQAQAQVAATLDFAVGNVRIAARDGAERPAAKGSTVSAGETVVTGDGRAQLRFVDGGYVSLLPDSAFAIREYRYDGRLDGTETGFYALSRGAVRAVTGWIGRVNQSRYMITTPTATIGVRGTGGLIEVASDGTTRVLGTSGIWTVTNAAGTIAVPAGTAAVVTPDPATAPRRAAIAPTVAPAARDAAPAVASTNRAASGSTGDTQTTAAPPYAAGDQRAATGTTFAGSTVTSAPVSLLGDTTVVTAIVNGGGTVPSTGGGTTGGGATGGGTAGGGTTGGGTAGGGTTGGGTSGGGGSTVTAVGSGSYTAFVAYGYETRPAPSVVASAADNVALGQVPVTADDGVFTRIGPFTRPESNGTARTLEAGNNGVLAWGRWVGNVFDATAAQTRTLQQQEGMHYVFGTPSISLPTTNPGGVAVVPYSLVAATAPTFSEGGVPSGTLTSGALGVDFGRNRVGIDLTAQFAGFAVTMQTPGGATSPATSAVSIDRTTSTFSGTMNNIAVIGSRPDQLCTSGCTGSVRGLFAGTDGAQAGLTYQVNSTAGTGRISGAAVFAK